VERANSRYVSRLPNANFKKAGFRMQDNRRKAE